MGEGKAGICGDGTIERLDRAGVHGQLRLTGLYVGVPRGERRRGQGESVSVRKHDGLIRYSTRNDAISLDARERGLLARKGLVCDLADWGWPLLPTRLPRCAQPGGGSPVLKSTLVDRRRSWRCCRTGSTLPSGFAETLQHVGIVFRPLPGHAPTDIRVERRWCERD